MQFAPILGLHVTAGMMGLVSGGAAVTFRKGSERHALAGKVFVASMLTMGLSAVYLAARKHDDANLGVHWRSEFSVGARYTDGVRGIQGGDPVDRDDLLHGVGDAAGCGRLRCFDNRLG